MAAVATNEEKTLCSNPFLFKRFKITADATSNNDITHNGPGIPDAVWCQSIGAANSTTVFANTANTATLISVDASADTDFYVFAIWMNAVAQDGTSITA